MHTTCVCSLLAEPNTTWKYWSATTPSLVVGGRLRLRFSQSKVSESSGMPGAVDDISITGAELLVGQNTTGESSEAVGMMAVLGTCCQ